VIRRLALLVRACHPEPTAAVTVLTGALFLAAGNPIGRSLVGTAAILCGQLSIGWSNDLLDRRRDRAAGRPDKPMATGALSARLVATVTTLAVTATVILSLRLGWPAGLLHLSAVGAGWAYNVRLKATAWSALPYLYAFAALPAIATLARHRHFPPGWILVAAGLIGVAAHFANVLPDLQDDFDTGVHGLPHRLGRRSATWSAAGLTAAVAGLILLARPEPATAGAAVLTLGLAVAAGRARPETAFPLVMLAAAVDVVALLASGGLPS